MKNYKEKFVSKYIFEILAVTLFILSANQFVFAAASPVTWINPVNVTVTSNNIAKNGGCGGCADSGAVSQQQLTSGNGYVEFTAATGSGGYIGLGNTTTNSTSNLEINFGLSFGSGAWSVRELNFTYRTDGTYTVGDVFRIAVQGTQVIYTKNGAVIYTSTITPAYPLVVDTSLLDLVNKIDGSMVDFGQAQPAPTPPALVSSRCSTYAAPVVPTSLRTFYINASAGNDLNDGLTPATAWKTLQKANNNATAGDLFLLRGVFVDQWISPTNSGTTADKITFKKESGQTAVLEWISSNPWGVYIVNGQSHIVVDGLEIRNTPSPFQITNNSHHIWLRNLYIHDSGQSTFRFGANSNRLEDSVINNIGSDQDNSGDALSLLNDTDNNVVVRNYFGNAGHSAYNDDIQGDSFGQNENNIVAQNIFNNQWASNFILAGRSIGTLAECNIMKNASQTTQFNYPRPGIQLDGKSSIIRYNLVYNNKADGMLIEGRVYAGQQMFAENNQIYQNTFVGNGRSGVYMDVRDLGNQTGTNAYIKNNIIENNIFWNTVGNAPSNGTNAEIVVSFYNANTQWANGFTDGNIFRYNNFSNIPAYNFVGVLSSGNFVRQTVSDLQATYSTWTNNRQQNPLFRNSLINDFSLLPTSPMINQGRLIPGVSYNGTAPDLGAIESRSNQFDFDSDGKADVAIYRPNVGQWWYLRSSNGGNSAFTFGNNADKIVPADYTGDGKTDVAFYRPSTGEWYILRSENGTFYAFPFGVSTDIPVQGDYDGDGKADAAIFRPSNATWYISKSSGGTTIQTFGANGDVPTVADYDGDGKTDIATFRPTDNTWRIFNSSNQQTTNPSPFGQTGDKPVAMDYSGDGKADIAVFRPSNGTWYYLNSSSGATSATPFGVSSDLPAPADFDGDGKADFAVFRSSNASWYILKSTSGSTVIQFGANGDVPVSKPVGSN